MNDFNRIAGLYDFLARAVFGRGIERATLSQLGIISPNDSVLILGGGTGRILKKLPVTQRIVYLDKSEQMVRRAKKHSRASIEFVNEDFLSFSGDQEFSVIICPFFLDCFGKNSFSTVIDKVKGLLEPNGSLIVTDFQPGNKKWLVWMMLAFFRIFAKIEARKLLDINQLVLSDGFKIEKEAFFHQKMIFSRVYRNL